MQVLAKDLEAEGINVTAMCPDDWWDPVFVKETFSAMRLNRAGGEDGVSVEVLRALCTEIWTHRCALLGDFFFEDDAVVPPSWRTF